jgi:acetyl esterase/lipase
LFFETEVLGALPPTTIYVGEREILYPDTLLLHQRAVEEDAPIPVVVGTGLVHNWAQDAGVPLLGYTQTRVFRPEILRQLGLTDDATVHAAKVQELEAVPAAAAQPSLLNVVGSFGWGLFDAFSNALFGQPQVPPGSTVSVKRSTLDLDCGPGSTVVADWYFPDSEEPPERLIYFQHGFPGTSVAYDYTAAELAERNNAIVVAPTITGNLFDCYACNLGGDPMHATVGRLFIGEREELLASARAAGFEGDALPQRFVLVGHSGGGQLAGGAAGYFQLGAPADEDDNLAGVILLDTNAIGGAIERGLDNLGDDVAVYTISAAPSLLNANGGMNEALVAKRPNQFVGVELVNGAHTDGFQSHNPLVQLGGALFSMAFSRPENVEAVQVLAHGWINDWYEGTDTGVYGQLGSTIDIPGTDGARAYVLPTPTPQLTFIDRLLGAVLESTILLQNLAVCAEDPSAATSRCSAELA